MLRFFLRSPSHERDRVVTQAHIASGGLSAKLDPATLSVVQRRGSYSGRQVTYFRAFDPMRTIERSAVIHQYTDLDACPELVVASGHIERDGAVVLSRRNSGYTSTTERLGADRSVHADDEAIVFPSRTA